MSQDPLPRQTDVPTAVEPTADQPATEAGVVATYRFLRLGILVLVLVVAVAVTQQVVADDGRLLPSISAYYYTSARAPFVAGLCAIGALMVVHRGRSAGEDLLLDAAGFLAFLVAFVPTARTPLIAGALSARPDAGSTAPSPLVGVEDATVLQNTWAVMAGGLVALVLVAVVVPRSERCTTTRAGRGGLVACAVAFAALAAWIAVAPGTFVRFGHTVAAVGFFVGIVAVVGVSAVARARAGAERGVRRPWRNRYAVGFVLLLVSAAAGAGVLRVLDDAWVFWLEAAVIVQFAAFWVAQTAEHWRTEGSTPRRCYPG